MEFWDTFWATMWGALGGAVIGAAAAWVFALDLRRRDRTERQLERDEEYGVRIRQEWSVLGSAFIELSQGMAHEANAELEEERSSAVERQNEALRALILATGKAGSVARGSDTELLTLLMTATVPESKMTAEQISRVGSSLLGVAARQITAERATTRIAELIVAANPDLDPRRPPAPKPPSVVPSLRRQPDPEPSVRSSPTRNDPDAP